MPTLLAISAFASLTLSCFTVSADPIHVSLTRRSGQGLNVNEEARRLKIKYGLLDPNSLLAIPSHPSRRRASSVDIPVINEVGLLPLPLSFIYLDIGCRHELYRKPYNRHSVSTYKAVRYF